MEGMGKGTSRSSRRFEEKERAKKRVEDLQHMFTHLSNQDHNHVHVEQQVIHMLTQWKNELNQPSPANSNSSPSPSQQGASLGTFSPSITRLLQLCDDEQDDATSAPNPHPDAHITTAAPSYEDFAVAQTTQEQICRASPSGVDDNNNSANLDDIANQLDFFSFDFGNFLSGGLDGEVGLPQQMTEFLPTPPSAFLGPKCALWDCPRPAQGSVPDYCSGLHAMTAQSEGQPGMPPVVRPKGIELKDSLLFAALTAKSQGKDVGVPECEGAATAKSPWNAPELFDISVFDGETLREWLFFDKPRRAFESGNRKQRSLPDYNGRGWHESRKQLIDEKTGWLKRSYYMDPQPMKFREWHLYEYEISNCDPCALYRLELKVVDGKKTPKGKTANDSVADLQKQMGRLNAEFQSENKNNNNSRRSVKERGKANLKENNVGSNSVPPNDGLDSFDYIVEAVSGDYL